jgi:hypothetical protein
MVHAPERRIVQLEYRAATIRTTSEIRIPTSRRGCAEQVARRILDSPAAGSCPSVQFAAEQKLYMCRRA